MEMKSSIFILFLLQTVLNLVDIAIADPTYSDIFRCKNDSGTYQSNSVFKTNLMSALNKLANETPSDPPVFSCKFAPNSPVPEQVTEIFLCASYSNPKDCASCVSSTIPLILQKCPDQKRAVAWRIACMVRYGPYVKRDYDVWFVAHEANKVKAKDVDGLDKALPIFVGNLAKKTVCHPKAYAYGTQSYGSPSLQIHMHMQCTLDLDMEECDKCILEMSKVMKPCCSGAIAAQIITPNCYMRYAHHDFRTLEQQSVHHLHAPIQCSKARS